jgi:hypothetical protein
MQHVEGLREFGSHDTSADGSAFRINNAQISSHLNLEDQRASSGGADGSINELNNICDDGLAAEHGHDKDTSSQGDLHRDPTVDSQDFQRVPSHPSMTRQETIWWAMSFEELYQDAREKGFGKAGKEGRKSGRVRIIKWLCAKKGITPYVVPSVTPTLEGASVTKRSVVRSTGAISHPEAILRTPEPALQLLIAEAEDKYTKWPANKLLELAMQRSYQLLKDSKGKLPSKSISAMSNWLAAWDILKSPREKTWWLRDGIDLVNRAKAMGYQGSSKKYDVILWLRTTPEESEAEVTDQIAQPAPNKGPKKRKTESEDKEVSKRPAKGSKRPHGWHEPQYM